jgi:hypothetical protein
MGRTGPASSGIGCKRFVHRVLSRFEIWRRDLVGIIVELVHVDLGAHQSAEQGLKQIRQRGALALGSGYFSDPALQDVDDFPQRALNVNRFFNNDTQKSHSLISHFHT